MKPAETLRLMATGSAAVKVESLRLSSTDQVSESQLRLLSTFVCPSKAVSHPGAFSDVLYRPASGVFVSEARLGIKVAESSKPNTTCSPLSATHMPPELPVLLYIFWSGESEGRQRSAAPA